LVLDLLIALTFRREEAPPVGGCSTGYSTSGAGATAQELKGPLALSAASSI
jgi:hypothetical protein